MLFGPFWAAGTQRNSGTGPKPEKHNFPVQGVPKRKKKVTTLSGMVVRNFLTVYVSTDRTPTGGKTQNTRIFGHFGLGRPLVLREIPGPGRKRKIVVSRAQAENGKKRNFPALGVPKSKKKGYHAIWDGCPQLFGSFRFAQTDPQGREIAKYGYFRPFGPTRPLALREIPGAG